MKYTIIIPFYDTIDFIEESLASICKQDNLIINDLQVLIINDGSNYDLQKIVDSFRKNNLKIEYHVKKNGNWGSVINYVKNQRIALGEYITILDSDDVFKAECFNYIEQYLKNKQPDILVSDFAEWYPKKHKTRRKKVLWNFRNKFWHINKHNIYKFKTPFSFPICKFYKKQIFYSLPDLKEGVSFQDINLYYESLYKARTYGYISKTLGCHRADRPNSSTNELWNKHKVDMWVNAIKDMAQYDVVMNALFYTTVKHFKNAYLCEYTNQFLIRGKIKTCYISKFLYIPAYFFIIYLYIKFHKVFKHVY